MEVSQSIEVKFRNIDEVVAVMISFTVSGTIYSYNNFVHGAFARSQ